MKLTRSVSILLACTILSVPAAAKTLSSGYEDKSAGEARNATQAQQILPYGMSLFEGRESAPSQRAGQARRPIVAGDRLEIHLYGAITFDGVSVVDQNGSIFVPEAGPVSVEGKSATDAAETVRTSLEGIYSDNVKVHVSLLDSRPVSVFVTGGVEQPGRVSGSPSDSLIDYLIKAGGIDPDRGSFRHIEVMRNGKLVANADLYKFLHEGHLPHVKFTTGDTIIVRPRGPVVTVKGAVAQSYVFEGKHGPLSGRTVTGLGRPNPSTSAVMIERTHDRSTTASYLAMDKFQSAMLKNGDTISFGIEAAVDAITVNVEGDVTQSRYALDKTTTLHELLQHIAVDPGTANLRGIHIRRPAVAAEQKKALEASLERLERSVLTPGSQSAEEATIRVQEAKLVSDFVSRAREVEPDGKVVVNREGRIQDIRLRDGDVVVIPDQSDIVMVHGEVMMPKAVVWTEGLSIADIVDAAGGFTERADHGWFVVSRPDGSSAVVSRGELQPGDQVFVMPEVDDKNFQMAKDVVQVLYQLAVGASVFVKLF